MPAGLGRSALPSWFLDQLDFPLFWSLSGEVEAELLHTYSRIDPYDTLILCVRVAVLTAVTLTVPIVLFPVSTILAPSIYTLAGCKIQWNSWKWLFFFFYYDQVRRAIQQMMFPNKTFNWPRHIAIAFILLSFINLLVIFAPNILGIFGVIGRLDQPWNMGGLKHKHLDKFEYLYMHPVKSWVALMISVKSWYQWIMHAYMFLMNIIYYFKKQQFLWYT